MANTLLGLKLESDSSSDNEGNDWWPSSDLNQNDADPNDILVAKEMFELSAQEREKINDDIHAVATAPEEPPEFLEERFTDMNAALALLPKSKRKALERATFLKPSLASDKGFKLMFLRADCYDATRAAARMAKFYEKKLSLFGEEKLVKKITSEDLSEEDILRLDTAGCTIEVETDPIGRPIWFYDARKQNFDDLDSNTMDSMAMTCIEDETAQLKGVCHVSYVPDNTMFRLMSSTLLSKLTRYAKEGGDFLASMPYRITSFHFCHNDPPVRFLFSAIRMTFNKDVRLRMRTHFGTDTEIKESLATFGIRFDNFLKNANETNDGGEEAGEGMKATSGIVEQQQQQSYIEHRREIEKREAELQAQQETKSGIFVHPRQFDVLVGRGRPYREYPGNRRLGVMIDENLERYRTGDRFQKSCILLDIVKSVHEYDGRFLQKASDGWVVVAEKVAREKAAKGFRFRMGKEDVTADDAVMPGSAFDAEDSSGGAPSGVERRAKRYKPDPRLDSSMK